MRFRSNDLWFAGGFAAFAVFGAVLRLWGWPAQVLLDDEWHALNFVIGKPLIEVLFHQTLGANSLPVNLYESLLLHTVGWSEPLLRLPSLLAGIAAVVVIPLLGARLWGRAVGLVAAALLAVAPAAIFYSRVARPYAGVMLFGGAAVLLALLWLRDHRRRDVVLASLCGVAAVWGHLSAIVPVGIPFALVVWLILWRRPGPGRQLLPGAADLWIAAGIVVAVGGPLVVLPNVLEPWWTKGIHGVDGATIDTALTVMGLVAGSTVRSLQAAVVALAAAGWFLVWRGSRLEAAALGAPFAVFAVAMSLSTQEGAHAGIQVARYGITFFPLTYLLVALAVVRGGRLLLRALPPGGRAPAALVGAAMLWAPYLATSPLRTTYRSPNSFTGHSAYQFRYEPIDWELSPERDLAPGYRMRREDVPKIYTEGTMLADAAGVIEYPMLIGDHFNIYYYYQHFHRRPAAVGFIGSARSPRLASRDEWVFGDTSIDYVLGRIPAELRRRCAWHSLVDLQDAERLRRDFKGWVVIVHRNPLREAFPLRFDPDTPGYPLSARVEAMLARPFGAPVWKDPQLAAWVVR